MRADYSALSRIARSGRLRKGSSHFAKSRFEWFNPTEPQATAAFVKLINTGSAATQTARANALLNASLSAQSLIWPDTQLFLQLELESSLEVSAEWSTTDRKRMDIIARGRGSNGPVEIIIEAKFGHHIADQQLQGYTSDERGTAPENRILVVVAPKLTMFDAKQIFHASTDLPPSAPWRFLDWRSFLIEYSCALPSDHDDEEFMRLRHTLHFHAKRWS